MARQQTNHRPARRPVIRGQHVVHEEYVLCKGDKCRNAIASWVKSTFCSRCRGRSRKARR
jgi:hypothetical protein